MTEPRPVRMPRVVELIGGGRNARSALVRTSRRIGGDVSRLVSRAILWMLWKAAQQVAMNPSDSAKPRGPSRVAPRARPAAKAPSVAASSAPDAPLYTLRRRELSGSEARNGRAGSRSVRDLPRIALLNPPRFGRIPVTRLFRSEYLFVEGNQVPAMDLAYFAAAAKGRAHLTIIEANGEDLSTEDVIERLVEFRPDVIVQKGVLNVLHHDLAASAAYKKRNPDVRVVLSCRGSVDAEASVFAEFPFLDAIARGEIDAFARDIAERPDLRGIDGLALPDMPTTTIRVVEDLDEVPLPDLESMPAVWYSGFNLFYYGVPSGYFLTTSRGCPYTCTFCMVGGIDGRPFRYRKRDPRNVVEEVSLIRRKYGIRDFYVFDEIFTMPGHGDRVCEALLAEGVGAQWICEGKPDLVNASMLSLMKRAGCMAIYYGVESGDEGILLDIEKGHTGADARRALELTRAAGILAGAYVMLGFPGETAETYLRTVGFLLETRPDLLRYDFLLPYPVTVLHKEMVRAGLLGSGGRELDRRISPYHDEDIIFRTQALGPVTLKAMELLLKQGFQRELRRSPCPSASPAEGRRPQTGPTPAPA
jgi:anaerobic magnesium-protoporphyrin IX monomethyl ester cyclase